MREVRDDLTAMVIFLERSVGEKGGSCEAMESYVRDVHQAEKPARAKVWRQEGQQNELLQKQRREQRRALEGVGRKTGLMSRRGDWKRDGAGAGSSHVILTGAPSCSAGNKREVRRGAEK